MIYTGEGILHLSDDVTVESGGEIPRDWAESNKGSLQSLTDRGLTDGKPSEKKSVESDDKDEVKRLNSEIKRLESELKKSVDKKSDKIIKDLETEVERLKSAESESQEKIKNLESVLETRNRLRKYQEDIK